MGDTTTAVTDKVQAFFSKYPARTYSKGQVLVFANENPEHIFYLTKGRVRKYDVSYRGEKVIVNIFKTGAFFPMSWALDQTPNAYYYETEAETQLHVIPPEDAKQFLINNPDVTLDLLARVYRGTEGLMGRMVHLMSGTARSRVLYDLIVECRRFGTDKGEGAYELRTNEVEIAARSGLSRETVSREMRKLKDRDWVRIGSGIITINDLTNLERAIGEST
jgi:CRP-like cAMP-binding protein